MGQIEAKKYKRIAKKTGNSIQATIPSDIVDQLDIKAGDKIVFSTNDAGEVTLEKEQTTAEKLGVDQEFLNNLNEGMEKYDAALKDLIDR